jgi:hypothetical protein
MFACQSAPVNMDVRMPVLETMIVLQSADLSSDELFEKVRGGLLPCWGSTTHPCYPDPTPHPLPAPMYHRPTHPPPPPAFRSS